MSDKRDVTMRQEQILHMLITEGLAANINPAETGGLPDDELARQLGISEEEIREDLQTLADLGFVEPLRVDPARQSGRVVPVTSTPGGTLTQDPVGDADTNPDTWLHARDQFEPLAAAQCYPYVFLALMERLEGTGAVVDDVTRVLHDDSWLDFVRLHAGMVKCEPQDALMFLAGEIVEQMLRRINAQYPVTKGYSPVHIALVAVYRAMRAGHDRMARATAMPTNP